ncbi:hypothetical protein BC628DRAFT_237234 [Trametes gibbosa]|nr:hypothetical protein BC628DRAFT_237234 [Trametes gibbosa]
MAPQRGHSGEGALDQGPDSSEEVDPNLKERTITYYFMAVELLEGAKGTIQNVHHDLESFYWVLIWVILRHTDCFCEEHLGPALCGNTFVWKSDTDAAHKKRAWLTDTMLMRLVIRKNSTLTDLLAELTALVIHQIHAKIHRMLGFLPENVSLNLTHDVVLNAPNTALDPKNLWP